MLCCFLCCVLLIVVLCCCVLCCCFFSVVFLVVCYVLVFVLQKQALLDKEGLKDDPAINRLVDRAFASGGSWKHGRDQQYQLAVGEAWLS